MVLAARDELDASAHNIHVVASQILAPGQTCDDHVDYAENINVTEHPTVSYTMKDEALLG